MVTATEATERSSHGLGNALQRTQTAAKIGQMDIEMEQIQVNSVGNSVPAQVRHQSLYLSNKTCKKQSILQTQSNALQNNEAMGSVEPQSAQPPVSAGSHTRGAAVTPINPKNSVVST